MQTIATPSFSSIRISLVTQGSLRAMASCSIHGAIMLTGIRVVEGKNGLFVSMPQRKNVDGTFQDLFYPMSRDLRDELTKSILNDFERVAHSQPTEELAA